MQWKKLECHKNWETRKKNIKKRKWQKKKMSQELKCHNNVPETKRTRQIKGHKNWNVTRAELSQKTNVRKTEI